MKQHTGEYICNGVSVDQFRSVEDEHIYIYAIGDWVSFSIVNYSKL